MNFIRLACYIYIGFVAYILLKENSHDKRIEALLSGNIVIALAMATSCVIKVFSTSNPTWSAGIITPAVFFWMLTHFYVYLKKDKKE